MLKHQDKQNKKLLQKVGKKRGNFSFDLSILHVDFNV